MKKLLVVVIALFLPACGGKDADPEPTNQPPEIVSEAPTNVSVYQEYFYQVGCVDPDGDEVSLALGGADTCGGNLDDLGNGTGTYLFVAGPGLSGSGCTVDLICVDLEYRNRQTVDVSVDPAADLSELTFGPFVQWATPIEDYISINTDILENEPFMRGIHDLTAFEDRLYLGYGDANLNLGRNTPIQLRYWDTPDPEAVQSDFTVNEEQVSLYRRFGDLLVIPGVDATEDAFLGNAYTLKAGSIWFKSRTLDLGWHVHDVAVTDATMYACGSGGTRDDYNNSTVNALLWGSGDEGRRFVTVQTLAHPNPPGDHRLTNLLVVDGVLYAFGYYSAGNPLVTYPTAFVLDENQLVDWADAPNLFVTRTLSLAPDRGLLIGVKIEASLTWGATLVTANGPEPAAALDGVTVLDGEVLSDGRTLLFLLEGDEYPTPDLEQWNVRVVVTEDGLSLTDLVSQTLDVMPLSVAFWRRDLFLGLDDGSVWRARGADL